LLADGPIDAAVAVKVLRRMEVRTVDVVPHESSPVRRP
jgi:hypothetical protein